MSNPSTSTPMPNELSQQIQQHKARSKQRARVAILLGLAAMACSLMIVSAYTLLIRPKQKHALEEYMRVAQSNAQPGQASTEKIPFNSEELLMRMIQVNSFCIMLVAISIGLLAIGTVVTISVVLIHREAVSDEIRITLADMSENLKKLSQGKSA